MVDLKFELQSTDSKAIPDRDLLLTLKPLVVEKGAIPAIEIPQDHLPISNQYGAVCPTHQIALGSQVRRFPSANDKFGNIDCNQAAVVLTANHFQRDLHKRSFLYNTRLENSRR